MDPARLRPGNVVRVPVGPSGVVERQMDDFIWPVDGLISSRFGRRGRRRHEGLDLQAVTGTPVRAAEFGVVVSSGRIGNYGNVVIIRHPGRFVTVYAHNEENLVRAGAWVKRGQIIARVGQTGNATGPHLHFEVRRDKLPRDPLYYLPVGPPTPVLNPLARTE
jgi:murein DD-endopeptidase MepM/ murein hydrolase activator NlpD